MTDAPKPTQEEQDRALWYARMLAPTPADNENHNLARCHIHATAELARAEERIRDLGGYLAAALANHMAPNVVKLVAERGMKLARGEEETTMKCTAAKCELPDCPEHTTKFTPKPGELPTTGAGWLFRKSEREATWAT